MFYDLAVLKKTDENLKPGGAAFTNDAIRLAELYEDRAKQLVLTHMKTIGVGNPDNPDPYTVPILRRLVDALSVVYRTPPVRRLTNGDREFADNDPASVALATVYDRMAADQHWACADRMRNLYGTVAVVYQESNAHRSVQMRVIEPFNLLRAPSSRSADVLDEDEAVAFCVRAADRPPDERFELWVHEDDGTWCAHMVNGDGEKAGTQPYGDEGISPFGDVLPAQIIYAELPRGRAYLPIPASRIAYSLGVNAIANDLAYLLQQEAHTTIAVSTDDSDGVPDEVGPGSIWSMPSDSQAKAITTNPKISESGQVLDQILRLFATGESLPADTFQLNRSILTGQALKVQERPLEARRQAQSPMAAENERMGYAKIARVHNVFAASWDQPLLDAGAELRLTLGRAWQPVDPRDLQQVYFGDLEAGSASIIDYMMERWALTRDAAIQAYERVKADRELYPVVQNMAARIEGPNRPGLDASRTDSPAEAINLRPGNTEGASVLDAVRNAQAAS